MQQFRYILAFFALLTAAACESNQEVENRLVAAFGETMFHAGPEAHGEGQLFTKSGMLAKWNSPVTVAVMEAGEPANIEIVRKKLAEMSEASGLAFNWVEPGGRRPQLRIYFDTAQDFIINGNERADCYTRIEDRRNGYLYDASVHVGLAKEGEWRTGCLTHELLHALGWRGHTHRVRSAISYAHGETEMTRWDRLMMRTLYDTRLQPGMPKEEAMPLVRAILAELVEGKPQ
jgi:hypothetical protein